MVPRLLVNEVMTALAGGLGLWALGALTPLQDQPKKVLQGGILLTTVFLMGRIGGIW